mmetsp:Transcript_20545/g.18185  ORF Transcript_20545/g.18185 Transcript_20545/m.18185 type:complete len:108 (+) Transcript_20545:104-427(+)
MMFKTNPQIGVFWQNNVLEDQLQAKIKEKSKWKNLPFMDSVGDSTPITFAKKNPLFESTRATMKEANNKGIKSIGTNYSLASKKLKIQKKTDDQKFYEKKSKIQENV